MQLLIFEVFTCVNHFYPSQQSRIQLGIIPYLPEGLVGSNGLFGIWLLRNQVASPFAPILLAEFGGLKWTRTIDLTLIRRVL